MQNIALRFARRALGAKHAAGSTFACWRVEHLRSADCSEDLLSDQQAQGSGRRHCAAGVA